MTVRNNQDRLGPRTMSSDPPIPESILQQQKENSSPQPTLQFVTPTEFVDLPSRGKFYSEGHPLHNIETIEIRHMTARDEDILTSRTLLKKGLAIDRFLQNILIDKSINIDDLLVGDKNAITIASRVTGYGPHYDTKVVCPNCAANVNHSFDLAEAKITTGEDHRQHGIEKTSRNTFTTSLPSSKVSVEVRLLTSRDEKRMLQLMENKTKRGVPESNLTDQLRMMIVAVDGNEDINYINAFVDNMPAYDSRVLRSLYQLVVPNIDLTHSFTCSTCGHEGEVDMPFGATFFWPK